MSYPVQILRVQDGQFVEAVLSTLTDKHLSDFDTFWKHRLRASQEEDAHWEWVKKNRIYVSELSNYEKYAIECGSITQGLMLLETRQHRSWFEESRRLVYVDYLATAPWNRATIQNPPDYRLVGSTLLEFARNRSRELGYDGLVGLHALDRAVSFYEKIGMANCGKDAEKEDLTYFEWYRKRPAITDEV